MDKIVTKDNMAAWLRSLREKYEMIGPVKRPDGAPEFRDIDMMPPGIIPGGIEVALDNAAWLMPPKDYLLPPTETLFTYDEKDQAEPLKVPLAGDKPRLLLGLRACDARAIRVLDHVYLDGAFADPYYAARRKGMVMVGNVCDEARWSCFCTSVGEPVEWLKDLDAVITDIGAGFVVTANTPVGESLLDSSYLSDPSDQQMNLKVAAWDKLAAIPKRPFADKLAKDFLAWDDPIWEKYARKCLGCGICSYLCPSCSCFDIQDERVAGQIERFRCRDTCQTCYFTLMPSHNPRPEKKMRMRQRLSHKFKYQPEQFDIIGCTGCGRCVELCPVNLDIRQALAEVTPNE
ncbi:MAG: 4Fe-4S dicluster domain-containing protein [Armatimonadota bacterium]|nr:4Fe-4S dicluster domain-containing protein [Armatimonadota bacterium]